MSGDYEFTERQIEFRNRLTQLMGEYVADIGPQFGGIQNAEASDICMSIGWVLIGQWSDMTDGEEYIVKLDSGIKGVTRRGLLSMAKQMENQE